MLFMANWKSNYRCSRIQNTKKTFFIRDANLAIVSNFHKNVGIIQSLWSRYALSILASKEKAHDVHIPISRW